MEAKTLALIATLTLAISSSMMIMNSAENMTSQFESFKSKHGKIYESEAENVYRQTIYTINMQEINEHNAKEGISYTKTENKFTDLTKEEFAEIYLMKVAPKKSNEPNVQENVATGSINWVTKGAVQAVKDQGQCGSCWAFSTAAVAESWMFIRVGTLGNFSEQQLVSCDTADGNAGCNGGWPYLALDYYAKTGICTEESYPYTSGSGDSGTCLFDTLCKYSPYEFAGHANVDKTVSALKSALDTQPVSICLDANNFNSYSSGIFDDCGENIDHAVLAAGYSGDDYWLVKNSWGTWWGENGYIRLKGGANTCGLLDYAVVPTG